MAVSVMTILPIIVMFFFAQKQFIQGIALTGLKG
jgi:multiple sugar transport system permease protein